ncbi:hypothetical protein ACFTSF_06685 [Kribbella sp. NPDC056951]|uniref:hypothetical protein n=1 Tax=Kribbella sp. NPDC056951 TaxID=3345978 RepID=UPI00363574A2
MARISRLAAVALMTGAGLTALGAQPASASTAACSTWQYTVESGGTNVYDSYTYSSPIVGGMSAGVIINSRSVGQAWVRVDNWYFTHGGTPHNNFATDYIPKSNLNYVDCW